MDFLNLVFSEHLNNTVVPFGHVITLRVVLWKWEYEAKL